MYCMYFMSHEKAKDIFPLLAALMDIKKFSILNLNVTANYSLVLLQ